MCQRDMVTEKVPEKVPSELERRAEIDMRVGALLAKREIERYQYQRGFWDCLYLVAIAIWLTVLFWPEIKVMAKGK